MFNVGGGEFLVILLIALIVLGPQRLPEAARQAGKVMGELRRISSGFQSELRTALADAEKEASASSAPIAAVDPEVAAAIAEATAAAEQTQAGEHLSAASDDDQAAAS